ncbi:peptidoglycan-binding domain-containing protein [Sphingobium sp. HBC34]|uniref:Peptidoglycan-binding domain-containing protein n=1 Tax=Sphingobium cyanobacteriorum TaxID=3063954 RepID=A0ABT8ZI07_9SPHN|nr:peptidoglycan-binding domain-containing protein [Sphingobium sp. HBC34]MDO7833827.1 peptidoglycan-binding domain-containing protein [Sphingobium sp. HBC34]
MPTGHEMLMLARSRIGQKYVNILVPKNNPNWQGPWDCAEFMSWLVYQTGGFLYGCIDNDGNPATTEAYTGAWQRDSEKIGHRVSIAEAIETVGAILLRYPPAPGTMGHIVVSDGAGGTVEAMGKAHGVCEGKVTGRVWDTGVLIPGFTYSRNAPVSFTAPHILYAIGRPDMKPDIVKAIQKALIAAGFDPGPVDGIYGHNTAAAVAAFQTVKGIIVDGQVGKQTARRLQVKLS